MAIAMPVQRFSRQLREEKVINNCFTFSINPD